MSVEACFLFLSGIWVKIWLDRCELVSGNTDRLQQLISEAPSFKQGQFLNQKHLQSFRCSLSPDKSAEHQNSPSTQEDIPWFVHYRQTSQRPAAVFENKNWSAGYHKAAFLMVHIFLIYSLLCLFHITTHISAQQDRDRERAYLWRRGCAGMGI